ncbi:MAG: acyl-CoA thioesterase [Thermoanaerobaculia bacterium]|nr:acyl-CoA thioesterase [Thermoanaerobaculia bacterium]
MASPPSDRPHAAVEVEVRYAETDQMGVVHHANYLVWFELARTRLCAETGFHYAEIERSGYLLMVVGAALRYRSAARYGDRVAVTAWLERLASRAVTFAYEVRRGADLLATGTTEHLWVEAASRRPAALPGHLRGPFARLAGMPVPEERP